MTATQSFKLLDDRTGRPQWDLRVRDHGGEGPADKYTIVELLVDGQTSRDAGKQLHRSAVAIRHSAGSMGCLTFSSGGHGGVLYDFGEPFGAAALRSLWRATGLSIGEFALQLGLKRRQQMDKCLRSKTGVIAPQTARSVIAWRDNLIRHLLATGIRRKDSRHQYGPRRILRTFFPQLGERYRLLNDALRECHEFLTKEPTAGIFELKRHMCEQAMLETAGRLDGKLFVSFLPWSPKLMPYLAPNLDRIRRGHQLFRLALEALAGLLVTTPDAIYYAVRLERLKAKPVITVIPPAEMRLLILGMSKPAPAGKRNVGRKGETTEVTTARITVAAYWRLEGLQDYDISPYLYPLHETKTAAWNSAKNAIFKRHQARIIREQKRLAALFEIQRGDALQSAEQKIPRDQRQGI